MSNLGTFSGNAKAVLIDAAGSRHYVATVDNTDTALAVPTDNVFEYAAGAVPTVFYKTANSGVPTSLGPTTSTVALLEASSATVVQSITVGNPATDQTLVFAALAKAGTYRIRVQANRSDVPPQSDWLVNSDNTSTLLVAGQTNDWAAGYLRAGTTIASLAYSDVSLGGAAPGSNRFVYPESQFFRLTLGHAVLAQTRDATIAQRQAAAEKSTNTATFGTATPAVLDITRTGGVGAASGINNAFTVGDTNTAARVTFATSALSSLPFTHLTSVPSGWTGTVGTKGTGFVQADSPTLYTIDPRITFLALLQFDSVVFATPPTASDGGTTRLASQFGFVAARARNAESTGLTGLAWTEKLWDNGTLTGSESTPTKSRATVSTTQGGQIGWSDALLGWDNQLPGGSWTQKQVITTANATGLEASNSRTLTLNGAANPRLQLAFYAVNLGDQNRHVNAGDSIKFLATLTNLDTGMRVVPTSASFFATHFTAGGVLQYLNDLADNTAAAWVDWTSNGPVVTHALNAEADTTLMSRVASFTAGWGVSDMLIRVNLQYGGSTYLALLGRELTGAKWAHGSTAPEADITFDAAGHAHTGGATGAAIGDRS